MNRYITGIVLLVVGVILLIVGLNATDSFSDRWSHFSTDNYTDRTVWFVIGGIVAAVTGVLMMFASGCRRVSAGCAVTPGGVIANPDADDRTAINRSRR